MANPDRDFLTRGRVTVVNSVANVIIDPVSVTVGSVVVGNVQIAVGANVVLTTANLTIGNSTSNIVANSSAFIVANSSIHTGLTLPSAAQQSGSFFLHANGSWASITTSVGSSQRVYQSYVASASQTVFNVSGGFQTGQIDVYYNGVHLLGNEYTQDGVNVTLNSPALAGTLVEVVGYLGVSLVLTAHGANGEIQFANNGLIWSNVNFKFDGANTLNFGTFAAAANGYTFLPNGILMQWGWVAANTIAGDVTFPVVFPHAIFSAQATSNSAVGANQVGVFSLSTSGMSIRSTSTVAATNTYWTAIGN